MTPKSAGSRLSGDCDESRNTCRVAFREEGEPWSAAAGHESFEALIPGGTRVTPLK